MCKRKPEVLCLVKLTNVAGHTIMKPCGVIIAQGQEINSMQPSLC